MEKPLAKDVWSHDGLDFNGSSILVTGGTGSFGQLCIRAILENFDDVRVIVFSRDEHKQYDFAQALGS